MDKFKICIIPLDLIMTDSFKVIKSSFFVMAEIDDYKIVFNLLTKIVNLNCNHIFICGKHSKFFQIILLDILLEKNEEKLLFSRYDNIDDDSIWDFLFLNQFEFDDEFKIFIPTFDIVNRNFDVSEELFATCVKVISRESEL